MEDEYTFEMEEHGHEETFVMEDGTALDDGVTTYLTGDAIGSDGDIIPEGTTLEDL
jgi:hypothetical protein